MTKRPLRHGYTTGACAAAAAKGAALLMRDGAPAVEVAIVLPRGEVARFSLHRQELEGGAALCSVIKDAGDDPDITNGAEIRVRLWFTAGEPQVAIEGGQGIGRVTKPGLAVPVGEWAINPVPRRMIEAAVREIYPAHSSPFTVHCSVSIPNGSELAQKTLNRRLGIIGGLSILGTTGIVRPISAKAWTDTIDAAIDVALACGYSTVVFSTGRTSEMTAERCLGLQEESYVMMGDHVGYALRSAAAKGVRRAVIIGQFAKLLKIACGHEQTHVSSSELDLRALAGWLAEESQTVRLAPLADRANTARQVLEESGNDPLLIEAVVARAGVFAGQIARGVEIEVLLAGYDGSMLYRA